MGLLYKQLIRQTGRDRVFIVLLFFLAFLTALSFFFVKFSIDGNKAILDLLPALNQNQIQYKRALTSNTSLAYIFLLSMTGLTAFVFILFFYRFFRSNMKTMGCLKAIGFKDRQLCSCFVMFTGFLSLAGSVTGLLAGYALSGILIEANIRTYSVTGLVKGISPLSIAAGLGFSTAAFCFTAFLCYWFVRGKEPGRLIAGGKKAQTVKTFLLIADHIVNFIPVRNKAPLRIALRKPLAVFLIFAAVMSFNVCMILGHSLNISSQIVFRSQTAGHNYEYDSRFSQYIEEAFTGNGLPYLHYTARITVAGFSIEQTVIGLYGLNGLYELQGEGVLLPVPEPGSVYINPGLAETYGVKAGDVLTAVISGRNYNYTVAGTADNAKSASVFVNAPQLSEMLEVPAGSYNGIWSMEKAVYGGNTEDKAQRIAGLEKNAVSNNTSAVINQTIGGVVGCILLFLAVYVNFQDNMNDIRILRLMGHGTKEIRSLLIDVYRPILWVAFLLTIVPGIFTAEAIQRSLSVTTGDYMPFSTKLPVVFLLFILLDIIYLLGKIVFSAGIGKVLDGIHGN